MSKKSVFVDEITAAWIAESLPQLAAALRAEGATEATAAATAGAASAATDRETAVAAARAEATTAERERILLIQGNALPGHRELVTKLIGDGVSAADAATQILTAERAARRARLGALKDDESDLDPPTPGPTPENDVNKAAKEAVAYAVKIGVVK